MSGSELFWTTYLVVSGLIANVLVFLALVSLLSLWLACKVEDAQQRHNLYAKLQQSLFDEIER